MTPDAFSDLVLAAVCALLAWRCLGGQDGRAGVGVACLSIGFAALLGGLRFSSWEPVASQVLGAHRFASLVAAVAGFPLLAVSMVAPQSALVRHSSGAVSFGFVVGGFGIAAVLLGFKSWAQLAPALSGLAIAWAVARHRRGCQRWFALLGVLCLWIGFAAPWWAPSGVKTQVLHYALALGLLLLLRRSSGENLT